MNRREALTTETSLERYPPIPHIIHPNPRMDKQLATEVELADLKNRLLGADGISTSHLSRSAVKEKSQNNTWRNRSHSEDTGDLESEQIKSRERSRLRRNESADSRRRREI